MYSSQQAPMPFFTLSLDTCAWPCGKDVCTYVHRYAPRIWPDMCISMCSAFHVYCMRPHCLMPAALCLASCPHHQLGEEIREMIGGVGHMLITCLYTYLYTSLLYKSTHVSTFLCACMCVCVREQRWMYGHVIMGVMRGTHAIVHVGTSTSLDASSCAASVAVISASLASLSPLTMPAATIAGSSDSLTSASKLSNSITFQQFQHIHTYLDGAHLSPDDMHVYTDV